MFQGRYHAGVGLRQSPLYSGVWKQVGRYTDEDFARLENDSAVQKLYDNGELNAYLII